MIFRDRAALAAPPPSSAIAFASSSFENGLPCQCSLPATKLDAVSLDCARENSLRSAFRRLGAIERGEHGGDVVSVDHFRCKTFRFELAAIHFHIVLVHGGLALPQRIHVRKHGEIVEFVVTRKLSRFPDLPFGHFAIAHQDVYAGVAFIHARADREPRTDGKPLAQRTCRRVDAGNSRRGMAFEFA